MTSAVFSHLPELSFSPRTVPGNASIRRAIMGTVSATPEICGMW
jgi:hypothetical protein